MMNLVAEFLFLAGIWAPPVVVLAGALLLLIPDRSSREAVRAHGVAAAH
jgi:hypothetical protein